MIHAQTIPVFDQQISALIGQLDKAHAWCMEQGVTGAELLDTRLAPDMYPLGKQVDFIVTQVVLTGRRLADIDLPEPPEATATIAAHQDRLRAAQALIATVTAEQLDADPDRIIAMDLPNGMAFDLPAHAYVRDWALPQFWFHLMTAYALIRMRGVPIGKADFVPHMLRHLRPQAT